jgi:hypothetical protein
VSIYQPAARAGPVATTATATAPVEPPNRHRHRGNAKARIHGKLLQPKDATVVALAAAKNRGLLSEEALARYRLLFRQGAPTSHSPVMTRAPWW